MTVSLDGGGRRWYIKYRSLVTGMDITRWTTLPGGVGVRAGVRAKAGKLPDGADVRTGVKAKAGPEA